MEDWAATAEPVGGWRGGEGKLLRTEIFVLFLVPNIEWIKICKTGSSLAPNQEPQCLPPPPESPRCVLTSHAGLGPPSGRGATRSCAGDSGAVARPALPLQRPGRALLGRVLGARRPRARSNVQGKSPSKSKRDDSCNIPGPGAVRGAGRARGRGGGPAGRAAARGWGVSCRPAA